MVEKPFGTDLASAQAAEPDDERVLPGGRDLPGGSLAGPGPAGERAVRPVRQLGDRAAAQPRPRGERPDHDGRGVRRRRPRQLLRPHRGDPRRRAEPHAAGPRQRARRPARGPRPRRLAEGEGQADRVAAAADPGGHRHGPVRGLPGRRRRRARVDARRPTSRCGSRSTRRAGTASRSRSGPASACRSPRPRWPSASAGHPTTSSSRARPSSRTCCGSAIWPESEVGLTLNGKKPGAGLGPAAARTSRSRSSPDPTCARTTGSSAPP